MAMRKGMTALIAMIAAISKVKGLITSAAEQLRVSKKADQVIAVAGYSAGHLPPGVDGMGFGGGADST
jgi:hypothetical protein